MSFMKSAVTVGGLTMVSRVLGFVRDQLVAFVIGTGPVAEAFAVAQRFPNLFRALFAEGAFNAAFVPQFARRVEGEGPAEAHAFAVEVFSVLLTWLVLFSAVAIAAMPLIMYVIAPGFSHSSEKFDLAVELTRICFPYLLFMSLTALQSGVLNSLHRFTAAAAAPILLNIALIGANVVVWILGTGNSEATGRILAWGVFVAGVAQYMLLAVSCRRAGMPLVPRWPKMTPGVKKVLLLSVPGIVSGGIMQINLVIATMIATTIPHAVAWLYYADRLYQLPLGVIGVAIGVVLLPELSRRLRAGDVTGALSSQNRALELSIFLTLPAAAALMIMPGPILSALFEHGEFRHADTIAVSWAVAAFASGLPAFSMTKVFQPGFYAREDTRTPMNYALVSVAVNIVGSLLLSRFYGHVGIAVATSLAAWVNAFLLALTLTRRGLYQPDDRLLQRLPRILLSTAIMAAVIVGGLWLLHHAFAEGSPAITRLVALIALVGAGGAAYFGAAFATRAMTIGELKSMLRRTRKT
ncbi:MAG: murein biosynthesis integral membrane protein MurJ [Hyphomicrobiales bacterium]